MHRDFKNRKPRTEVETLTGYVVREGQKLGIETPAFYKAYQQLTMKK
jgi:2-dehydropantoate 2-reductase